MANFSVGARIVATAAPILAKNIPPGTTGRVTDLLGYRAYYVRFDGTYCDVACFPETIRRVPDDAATVKAPPPFKFKPKPVTARSMSS